MISSDSPKSGWNRRCVPLWCVSSLFQLVLIMLVRPTLHFRMTSVNDVDGWQWASAEFNLAMSGIALIATMLYLLLLRSASQCL
jgi:hypothetical protein